MQLTFTAKQQAFRAEVRAWLKANVPNKPLASYDTREGFEEHRAWEGKLYDSRLSMVMWPEHLGGRGCDLIEWLIFEEEYYAAGAPRQITEHGQLPPRTTRRDSGTGEQTRHCLPRSASSEAMWAQGWPEPNAGADMAASRSKALRDGDEFVINGQNTWSTRAT